MTVRHFTKDDDLTPAEQAEVLALAAELKASRHTAVAPGVLRLAPPLVLTDAQVDAFVAALPTALDAAMVTGERASQGAPVTEKRNEPSDTALQEARP